MTASATPGLPRMAGSVLAAAGADRWRSQLRGGTGSSAFAARAMADGRQQHWYCDLRSKYRRDDPRMDFRTISDRYQI
jgi:hypothetical protein